MGGGNWSDNAYSAFSSAIRSKSTAQVFTSTTTDNDMSPLNLTIRECRDNPDHPESLAISVNTDITGSMADIVEDIVRNKLGKLMGSLVDHGVKDAAVMPNAIGDAYSDRSPLQIGQFEASTEKLLNWLTKIHLEKNGGGNGGESYSLAWLIAARHTSIDCFEKRKMKGVLFTMGDEQTHPVLEAKHQKKILGYTEAVDLTAEELLAEAERMYHVFHIHFEDGSYPSTSSTGAGIVKSWKALLKERLIILPKSSQVAEIIATTVAMIHGIDINKFTQAFDSKTASDVKNALMHINTSVVKNGEGVLTL